MLFQNKPKFLIHFNDGAYVEQTAGSKTYLVKFIRHDVVEYTAQITRGSWLKTNIKYFAPWRIEIMDTSNQPIAEHHFDLHNNKIRIDIDSKCLGDTLAWLPQINQFSLQHPSAEIYVSQFLSGLGFKKNYPNLNFISPETTISDVYATYQIGYYFDKLQNYHPHDPRAITLGRVASDALGIEYQELRPQLTIRNQHKNIHSPYVCIATQSTAACKLWQHEGGWQSIVEYLQSKGLKTVVIQKEPCTLKNVIDKTGDLPLQDRMTDLLHCEFFIGLGSGLSWLAWALKKHVILISGFSLPYAEFSLDCSRVMNTQVCHGCWNSREHVFDRNDWNWCPVHKGSSRQFECSKSISPQQVIAAIETYIAESDKLELFNSRL